MCTFTNAIISNCINAKITLSLNLILRYNRFIRFNEGVFMMTSNVKELNEYWTDIYFHLHYPHTEKISHQAVRILQLVEKKDKIGVNEVANYLQISQNTASEHVKRMVVKNLLIKERHLLDERRVLLHLTKVGKDVLHRNTSLDEEKFEQVINQLEDKEKEIIDQAFKILSERSKTCL